MNLSIDSIGSSNKNASGYLDALVKSRVKDLAHSVGISVIRPMKETVQNVSTGILPTKAPITQQFGNYNPALYKGINKSMTNTGVDFGISEGTPLKLPSGKWKVLEVSNNNSYNRGYGNSVLVEDDNGEKLRFSHLSKVNAVPGSQLGAGSLLGMSGATGNVTGPHLDLEYYSKGGKVSDVTKSRFSRELFGQGGGGEDVRPSLVKANDEVVNPFPNPLKALTQGVADTFLYDDKRGGWLPGSMPQRWARTEQVRDQHGMGSDQYKQAFSDELVTPIIGMTSAPRGVGGVFRPKAVHPEDIRVYDSAVDAYRLGTDKKGSVNTIDVLAEKYLPQQTIDKYKGNTKDLISALKRAVVKTESTPKQLSYKGMTGSELNNYALRQGSTTPLVSARPSYELAFEKALNDGNKEAVMASYAQIPANSPYKPTATNMLRFLPGLQQR